MSWMSETLRSFAKFIFKQMLKVSAFYLERQKSFIPKNKIFGHCQYQNKKALYTDSIFQKVLGQTTVVWHPTVVLKLL